MPDFYHRLSYSFGNEDWITEQKALRIQPKDDVLCITASGDRPLNLLLAKSASIISIDVNPIQNALLDLKCAALKALSTEEYLAFMGVCPSTQRTVQFEKIKPLLGEKSISYWNNKVKAIQRGILFEGAIEKWMLRISYILRFFRGKKIKQLFSFNDLNEQKEFVKNEWETKAWKNTVRMIFNPTLTRLFYFKDPGLYKYVDVNIAEHILERVSSSLHNHMAPTIPILSMLFQGKVEKEALPPYLTSEGVDKMRGELNRLNWQTIDLLSFLKKQAENSLDCFSLSDVASYVSKKEFGEIAHEILRTARNGARFCIRQFMSFQKIPEAITSHFIREPELEADLAVLDKCFVYSFMVGTIRKYTQTT